MKKIISITALIIITQFVTAQNEVDVLRYSQTFFSGSARSTGMAGAFGALGGDFSSIGYNPAGLGVYRNSEFTITPGLYYNQTDAVYNGELLTDSKYNINLNQIGFTGAFTSNADAGWVSSNFSIGYKRINNFNKNILIEGSGVNSSITDYFLDQANFSANPDLDQWADLVYTDTLGDGTVRNVTDFTGTNYGHEQSRSVRSEGYQGEWTFAYGTNFSHKIYFGAALGLQKIRYEQNLDHTETDPDNQVPFFENLDYYDHFKTTGSGFNFKFGTIIRPIDILRFGISVETPTFLNLEDEYWHDLESTINYPEGIGTNTYNSPEGYFEYEITTPLKATGSLAVILKKFALISVDYEIIDYSSARIRSDEEAFTDVNKSVQTRYRSTGNLRAGAEFRYGPFSIRGGYALYGSPYNNNEVNKDASQQIITGGIGIRENDFFFDLGFTHGLFNEKYYMYPSAQATELDSQTNKILATIGFKF